MELLAVHPITGKCTIPTGRKHAHSFVSGPELRIQYTYTCVRNSEHHRLELDIHTSPLSQEFILQAYRHTYVEHFSVSDLELNTNTYQSRNSPGIPNRIYSRLDGNYSCETGGCHCIQRGQLQTPPPHRAFRVKWPRRILQGRAQRHGGVVCGPYGEIIELLCARVLGAKFRRFFADIMANILADFSSCNFQEKGTQKHSRETSQETKFLPP